jgi:hypothetical protein
VTTVSQTLSETGREKSNTNAVVEEGGTDSPDAVMAVAKTKDQNKTIR